MRFSVHQVTRRVGGGDIARRRTLETETPLIGRGADCDIHLPDLAVDLHHARLSAGARGLITIEALGELGFDVDGRFTRRADLDPVKGALVVIGRYQLGFSLGGSGEVKIELGVANAAADTPSSVEETALFTPRAALFGSRSLAWTLGLLVLSLCLAIPVALFFVSRDHKTIRADQQWTSGPLSKSHAFLQGDCQACHAKAFVAVRDDACLACHSASLTAVQLATAPAKRAPGGPWPILIRAHAAAGRLRAGAPLPDDLPGRLTAWVDKAVNHPNDRCASCHVEHVPAPAVAGLASPQARALPLLKTIDTCVDCHRSLQSRLPNTTLVDTPSWSRHPQFRPFLAFATADGRISAHRSNLVGTPTSVTGLIFSHRLHLLTAGGVARMGFELGTSRGYGGALDCAACHHADAAGRGFIPVRMERDCRACHTMAFSRNASGVQTLPHGPVAKLIAYAQSLHGGGAARPSSALDEGRRRPGEPILTPTRVAYSSARSSTDRTAEILRASAAPGGACAFCHRLAPPPQGSLAFVVEPVPQFARHLPAGAFDHGVTAHHQDTLGRSTCGACHAAKTADAAGAMLIPSIARCAACHGNRRALAPAAPNCEECHDYHAPGRPRLTARDREQIAAWRPSLIKVSQTVRLDRDR